MTGHAVLFIQGVAVDAGDRPVVLDAGEKRAARACDVHDAERPAGEDEAVGVAGCVAVKAGDLLRVVDAEGARAGRERKVDGG